ncbi:hypothetical protein ARMSODRAFT_978977 [Armillaria solidipes]|uniref:CCHC-type domain-containing protein n=1 Tax=Armillaria solidipes TaxID=1076256 RepID=A0A2H3B4X8_9AGAR|nr:hypothetical protein ARMSODRAFT_978977 [Armillaria solidipes]
MTTTTEQATSSSDDLHPLPPQQEESDQEEGTTPSTHMAPTTNGLSSPQSTVSSSAPNESRHGNSDTPTSIGDTHSPPELAPRWTSILPPTGEPPSHVSAPTPRSRFKSLLTETGRYDGQTQEGEYEAPTESERRRSSETWKSRYTPLPYGSGTTPTWTGTMRNEFDHFNYNRAMFEGYEDPDDYEDEYYDEGCEELDDVAPRTIRAGSFAPYPQYDLPRYPFPLPDTPPIHKVRQHGQYHGPRHPRLFAGGDAPGGSHDIDIDDDEAARRKLAEETAIKKKEAAEEAGRKLQRIAELEKLLNDAEMDHHDHAMQWGLPQSVSRDKGKNPVQPFTLPLPPNPNRPLWRRDDRYSVPRPPPDRGRPDPLPQPVGTAAATAPFMNVRPVMLQLPKEFVGVHDDIERFFGDCMMYFEAHASYFILPSHMIPFATSLRRNCKGVYWSTSMLDLTPARFRYPTWEEFVTSIVERFSDPAVMEVHKKKMFELRMGNGAATTYFQELEVEVTKAGRRHDTGERGLMVKAVHIGVPQSYTNSIASIGRDIPGSYDEWKARILVMYEERQKNWAFNQAMGISKPTSSGPPRDATTGKWHSVQTTTYKGAGEPMDIGQMQAKGLCFRCHKHGHLSKDCPEKRQYKDVRSLVLSVETPPTMKIEEVKEEAA